jgi:hypothetical protein
VIITVIPALRRAAVATAALLFAAQAAVAADPLPSWRDGPTKQRLLNFVVTVTSPGSPGYVTPAERIAVFDDDGTLWPEKPRAAGLFALPALRERAGDRPEWRIEMPFRGALELGNKYLTEASDADVAELLAQAFAGVTQDAFRRQARDFWESADHPRFGTPWQRLAYQPMRELHGLLRANGFRSFVVTTGHADFTRAGAAAAFGVAPDDVLGSGVTTAVRAEAGAVTVRRLAGLDPRVDATAKPLLVDRALGHRPLFAAGNVRDGSDVELLRYSAGDPRRPGLQLVVVHDDFEREYAYTEPDRGTQNAADAAGWVTVSMRYDWTRLFPGDPPAAAPGSAR